MKITAILNRYGKRDFVDFLTLALGSILGQGVAVLFAPVISRIYTTEQVGFYTLLLTAVGMFESVVCLRYDMIIVSEEKDSLIQSLSLSCFVICSCTSMAITVAYTAFLCLTGQISSSDTWLGLFIFIALICTGIILVLTAINNRYREYTLIAKSSFLQGMIHNMLSVMFGLIPSFGFIGLILGRIGGYLSYIFCSVRSAGVRDVRSYKLLHGSERMKVLMENKYQALYSTPAVILSCVSLSIINLFISLLYGNGALGLYSYSYRLLGLPLAIVSANLGRLFFKDASVEYAENRTMRNALGKFVVPLVLISIVMVLGFELFSPRLFAFVLGESWREAGVFVQILAPMYAFRLLSSALSNATIISKKQFLSLLLQVAYPIVSYLAYIVALEYSLDIHAFLSLLNVFFCVLYGSYFMVLVGICLKKYPAL